MDWAEGPLERVKRRLLEEFGEMVVALGVFGSAARGESIERSDVDFLIVTKGGKPSDDMRFAVYNAVHGEVRKDVTILDVGEEEIFREDLEVTPFLLNLASDTNIIHDPTGKLTALFRRILEVAAKLHLERIRTPDGKYWWKPKSGELRAVEVADEI